MKKDITKGTDVGQNYSVFVFVLWRCIIQQLKDDGDVQFPLCVTRQHANDNFNHLVLPNS